MVDFYVLCVLVILYIAGLFIIGGTVTASIFVFHVVAVPLIFKYSKTFRRGLIFANFVQWPLNIDFEDPSASGVEGARNISLEYQSKVNKCQVKIGIWHILPKTAYERLKGNFEKISDREELDKILHAELTNATTPIILYCHGNSNSRAAEHRLQLYKFFQKMDFHTITFDYRGYGDSTNIHPTEEGVVEDALVVYDWLQSIVEKSGRRPGIFVWGHSLGTAISSRMLGNLTELSTTLLDRETSLPLPKGLILEAPFNNLADEVAEIPLSKLVSWLPYYERTFIFPFSGEGEQRFESDVHLRRATSLPILVLHAKDDIIVPFIVGLKLYRSILQSRSEGGASIQLHAYDKSEKLGHKWICHASDLTDVIGYVERQVSGTLLPLKLNVSMTDNSDAERFREKSSMKHTKYYHRRLIADSLHERIADNKIFSNYVTG